ncbi:PREDICTED: putative B3 domain-containing protein Os03g0621600 [Nelumbo nucifera]|uniref:B3 domain-containing protein Os03g0621600 n=1 Tax=Nelumbo nucifera TaxID=4432 RepID=A0A1U8AMV5_NELNU|nr:PREDICTED: putative B3 domain-containing protein Os03g0621600 [Nelumbo nucifera]
MVEMPPVTKKLRQPRPIAETKIRRMTSHRRNRPSFFKVLIAPNFSRLLRIPPPFMKHFSGSVPKTFILRSPTGKLWSVRVKRIEKQFYFEKGWQRFVKHHRLVAGDLLVFSYHGDSRFTVKIYDTSSCEKELPFLLSSSSAQTTTSTQSGQSNLRPKNKKQGKTKTESTTKAIVSTSKVGRATPRRQPRNEAIKAASSYKTEFPQFASLCGKTSRSHMMIPKAVTKEVGLTSEGKAMLWDPRGRSWSVRVHPRSDGRADISGGWPAFRKANNIVQGDACNFEFIRGPGVVICVNIFREAAGFGELAHFSNQIPRAPPPSTATVLKALPCITEEDVSETDAGGSGEVTSVELK